MKKSNSIKIYQSRSSIYNSLRLSESIKDDKGILVKINLVKYKSEIKTIKKNISNLIYKCLEIYHHKKFIRKENFLTAYINEISSLPNITPNGAIRPKKEIIREYNIFHKSVVNLFKKIGIFKNIYKAMNVVIRIKKGMENYTIKKRSYATSKIHSDSWSGMALDSVAMIMLIGDVSNNTVDCYEPIDFKVNILKKMKKYDQGKKYYKKIKHIAKVKKNELVIFDQLCLHKSSISKNAGPRISIDVGIDWKKEKNNYNFQKKSRRYEVFSSKKWSNLNYGSIKKNNESLTASKFYHKLS